MDISSEYPTQKVTDYLFRFSNGQSTTVTIRPGDTVDPHTDSLVLTTTTEFGTEVTRFFKAHMLSYSIREREEIVYPKGESPAEKELKRLTDEAEQRHTARQRHQLQSRFGTRTQPREGAEV